MRKRKPPRRNGVEGTHRWHERGYITDKMPLAPRHPEDVRPLRPATRADAAFIFYSPLYRPIPAVFFGCNPR